jgi:hypothetical protein
MIAMNFDDLMIVIVVGGIALAGAYISAEYRSWRNQGAALRRRDSVLRELHEASLSHQQTALLEPSVVRLQKFTDTDAAAADEFAGGEDRRRSQARSGSQHPFVERRVREQQQASHRAI